ncbi:hypothetical protein Sste5346_010358 [Sporothrix stenoceras]|uniref:Uncharacterized protein n=1 Tax=Sporothrix stenoceras TaxID=5173 RepID=A0ABR3YGD0_9PEZI
MRFRLLVALFAGVAVAAVPVIRQGREKSLGDRSADNVDNNEHCPHDNLLRCLVGSPTLAYTFCSWSVGIYATPVTLYETLTVPATKAVTSDTSWTATQGEAPTETTTLASLTPPSAQPTIPDVSTVTVTQTVTQTVTFDRTPITTDALVQTVVQTVFVTTSVDSNSGAGGCSHGNGSLASSLTDSLVNATRAMTSTTDLGHTPPSRVARTTPKTSLACLDNLQPALDGVTSACSCFASSQPTPTATSTITYVEGAPACPAATRNGDNQPLQQPTFPNCFADFHPYNCGTDHVGQIACSCALTTEGTAQCTLGDYERDNACTTSDDCATGWYCTAIECFGAGVPSVCTKACPVIFAPQPLGGGSDNSSDDGTGNDNDAALAHPQQQTAHFAQGLAVEVTSPIRTPDLSIIIVNNNVNGFGSGRARGEAHRSAS